MTARLPSWMLDAGDSSADRESDGSDGATARARVEPGARVTGHMVDVAVANAVSAQGWSQANAEVLKYLLSRDYDSDISKAYYASRVAHERAQTTGVARKTLAVKYALSERDTTALVTYAPDFKLRFLGNVSHDHPVAAAMRLIDHKVVRSRLPYPCAVSDIGGNPMVYVRGQIDGVHVCGPTVDKKDSMRHVLRKLEARTVLQEQTGTLAAKLAADVLEPSRPGSFMCGRKAQECAYQSKALTAIHVYDIPMRDWPAIMDRKGAVLVEGCLLYSDQFWSTSVGVLDQSGARYEIDVAADTFSMGFDKSPSWWYTHKWSEYMLYGADQVLFSDNATYSYKIVERRGDTVFFRIVRTGHINSVGATTSYSTPGVPMVRVDGFELSHDRPWMQSALKRRVYHFPQALWNDMLLQASSDFERGALDYGRMYNHYRTMSVRMTVNSVHVMGGERVAADELVPLVVHVCLAAASMSMLGQRVTRSLTASEMPSRLAASESTMRKMLGVLMGLASAAALAPLFVFQSLGKVLKSRTASALSEWVLAWEPVWSVVTVDAKTLVVASDSWVRPPVHREYEAAAETLELLHPLFVAQGNPELAAVMQRLAPGLDLGVGFDEAVGSDVVKVDCAQPVVSDAGSSLPSYHTDPPLAVAVASDDEVMRRREAIREHIVEIDMSNKALVSSCALHYNTLMAGGRPNAAQLRKRAEHYHNPDMWLVERGLITESALGIPVADFSHSAVFSLRADEQGEQIRSVHHVPWQGVEDGQLVRRDHFMVSDESFTGWVLVTDELLVYNGPEIRSSMVAALDLEHDYEVVLHQGPPGCGKTYEIIHTVVADGTDVVMCPVRESAHDTRARLLDLHPTFPDPKLRVRTVDSYLVNRPTDAATGALTASRLLADECFMAHSGKWYAAAALLGVRVIHGYGDDQQIPHIVRVQAPSLHVRLTGRQQEVFITRRCPASAVAAWGSVYNWKVRSVSSEQVVMTEVVSARGREIPQGCVMMCMYQADKKTLRALYPGRTDIKIITANEAEGKTYKSVWLHRFDARKRTDKFSLFDRVSHVLVAMSRHTHEFVYVRPAPVGDLVSQWIARSHDPRRLAAAVDVETAGTSVEYL